MGITRNRGLLAIGVAVLLLSGCKSGGQDEETQPASTTPATTQTTQPEMTQPERVKPQPRIQNGMLFVPLDDDSDRTESLQGTFYFDFDQAIVKREGHVELNKHADYLRDNRMSRVRLEGHADERGTREYNMALGERRANAVRAYLMAQGASSSQMEVISYGEERPASDGHSDSSWAKNRRVEMKYR